MFQAGIAPQPGWKVWEREDNTDYRHHQHQQQPWMQQRSPEALVIERSNEERRRVFSMEDERLLTTVSNNHHHQQHQHQVSESQSHPPHDLPERLYDIPCSLVFVNDFLQCGVLQLHGSRGQTAHCLFLRKDVLVMARKEKLSYELPPDGSYRVNAWLINPSTKIPYLAANVWFEGVENIPQVIMQRIHNQTDADSLHVYQSVAGELSWDPPGAQPQQQQQQQFSSNQRNVVLVDHEEDHPQTQERSLGRKIVFRGDDRQEDQGGERPWSPMGQFREQLNTNRKVKVWEEAPVEMSRNVIITPEENTRSSNDVDPRTKQNRTRRKRSESNRRRSQSTSSEESPRKIRKRQASRKRSRTKERSRVRTVSPPVDLSNNKLLDQLVFEDCTTARITSYLGNGIGVLSIGRGTERRKEDRKESLKVAYFHTEQVWSTTPGLGLHQFSEVYRSRDVENHFRPGSNVFCSVRKIATRDADCQALFIGKTKEEYKEWLKLVSTLEDSSSLEESADQNLPLFLLQEKAEDVRLELLSGGSLCEARVKEYFSLDYGLLELGQSQAGTVLFNLSQVFLPLDNNWKRLKTSQLLSENLPVGTKVAVLLTRIPANQHSELKYQAMAVFKKSDQNTKNPLEFFKSKYDSNEEKLELKRSLRRHFDIFKNFLNLQAHTKNSLFSPLQVVLDTLPDSWQAVVVAEISREFGIIRISSKVPGKISLNTGRSLNLLNVLFHIEDVFCENGERAIQNNVAITSLLNKSVQLTARSICVADSPEGIFAHVGKLLAQDGSLIGVPVLQAVTVCLEPSASDQVPRPTVLRKKCPSFGSELSHYFLSFGLKTTLDIKLVQFLAEPQKPPLPYREHFSKSYDYKKEKSIVEDFKSIDTETSRKIIYGSLRAKTIDISQQESLPKTISKIDCNIVFLYRTNLKAERGVVQVKPLGEDSPVECLAYFQYSDVFKQRPLDFICKDLATLMPCNSRDKFCVSLQLQDPSSAIPYIVTKIWNETERLKNDFPEPTILNYIDSYGLKFRNSFIKSMIAACQKEPADVPDKKLSPPSEKKQKAESPRAAPVNSLSTKTSLVGKVLKIINPNYALAVCELPDKKPIQVLFDVYDVWARDDGDEEVLANLGKKITDVMEVGDFLRLHAIQMKSREESVKRSVCHMATAVICAKTLEDLNDKKFPEDAVVLENWEGVDDNKVENYEKVVKVLENIEMNSSEKEVLAGLGNMFGKPEDKKETIKPKNIDTDQPVKKFKVESKTNEIVAKKEIKLKSKDGGIKEEKSGFLLKKEIEAATEEMLKAANEVRESYRLSNPVP